jgi:type IX secretion system PorP/SprF family membrane protein
MKKVFLIFFLTSYFLPRTWAQDINFSQFYELPMLRNPALAGLFTGDIKATAVFRNQWNSVTVPYKTQGLGLELKFPINDVDYLALGAQLTNDKAGDSRLGKSSAMAALTFHKSVNGDKDSYLSLGFLGGPVRQSFDESKLRFDDQFVNGAYSATNPTRQQFASNGFGTNITYYDASVGLVYSSVFANDVKYYLGASYFHFTQPKVAFSATNDIRLNTKLMVNAGISIPSSDFDRIILYTDVFTQGGARQVQGVLLYKHDLLQEDIDLGVSLSGGVFTRWGDAVMPMLKLDYYKLGIGVTYDVNVSKLSSASSGRGGFEVTATYRSSLNIRNSAANAVRCPVGF